MSKREAPREPMPPAEDGREPLIRQVADGVHIENEQLTAKLEELPPKWQRHLKLTVAELVYRRNKQGKEIKDPEAEVLRQYRDLDPKSMADVPVGLDIIEATRVEGEAILESRFTEAFQEIRGYLQSLMD